MAQQTGYKYIVLDEAGRPVIEGTRMKVRDLVQDYMAHGWSPEEMQWNYPHLGLSQIYAAFSYYHDHKAEIDADIKHGLALYEELKTRNHDSPVRARLRAMTQQT